jgi:hypothetical protein
MADRRSSPPEAVLFPSIGDKVEFPEVLGGIRRMTRATVVEDPRNSDTRVAIQPEGRTIGGRAPAVRMRNRNKLVRVA